MSDFLEKLKEGAEKIGEDAKEMWEGAKQSFEDEAAAENAETNAFHDLFAWADGSLLALPYSEKEISEKDQQMKTLAVMLVKDQVICAPVNATVKSIDVGQNTIVLQVNPEQTLAIKVCVGSISFEKDAKILVEPGQKVRTGEALVRFNQPIEAKSKLLLLEPKTFADFIGAGYVPARKPGAVSHDEILITQSRS